MATRSKFDSDASTLLKKPSFLTLFSKKRLNII